ncbi:MAG: hypothetical protein JJU05_04505 [Verrucomicrobia bacterium]|nr:hypothetical protein [Verrucomicrobiota bacterium]MCH8525594.1 hypothetical protein [Kiritimatiellia bacterium]
MFELPGHHLGDTWFAADEERVHMYVLVCPLGIPRHTRWSIGHASSTDLKHWTYHGILFDSRPDDPQWHCLSTGSVCRHGDRWIMAFLANHNQPDPRSVLAESTDLFHWNLIPGIEARIDGEIYTRRPSVPFKNPRWRDPFVFEHEGALYQLMTAASEALPDDRDGVVGLMRTRDLRRWEMLPPLRTPAIGTDLECPKLHRVDGAWQLVVSLFNVLQAPDFAATQPAGRNPNTSFSLAAQTLNGPYEGEGDCRVSPEDIPGCPYACSPVYWKGAWYLLGTRWSDRLGDTISDPLKIRPTPRGFRAV